MDHTTSSTRCFNNQTQTFIKKSFSKASGYNISTTTNLSLHRKFLSGPKEATERGR